MKIKNVQVGKEEMIFKMRKSQQKAVPLWHPQNRIWIIKNYFSGTSYPTGETQVLGVMLSSRDAVIQHIPLLTKQKTVLIFQHEM